MGNQNDAIHKNSKQHKRRGIFSQFRKSKANKKHCGNKSDDFIIKYSQNVRNNDLTNIASLDARRQVFISVVGLYQTWKRCPSFALYSAIFILPLNQKWIDQPSEQIDELQSHFISQFGICYDVTETLAFIELLRWKHGQGLVIWMLDDYECKDDDNELVHPLWCHVSEKLSSLYDPITGSKYNKLNLDAKWWGNKEKFVSKYDTKASNIFCELYFLTMKYQRIKEILYQSNPMSLHAIQVYENYDISPLAPKYNLCNFDDGDANNDWWLSSDYDPNDLDQFNI